MYIGLVGARFEKPNRMDSVHMLVSGIAYHKWYCFDNFNSLIDENTAENGFGPQQGTTLNALWAKFYQAPSQDSSSFYFPIYDELVDKGTVLVAYFLLELILYRK